MSFGSHHLLRSRFSAGLQQRLRLGQWYRSRATAPSARYFVDDASKSNVTRRSDADALGHGLKLGEGERPPSFDAPGRTYEANLPRQTEDVPDTLAPAESTTLRQARSGTPILSLSGRRTAFKRGLRPRIVYNTLTVVNGEKTPKQRLVSPEAIELETSIRSKSLFYDGNEVRKWRSGCAEVYRAKFYGRKVRDELVSSELTAEDTKLLEKINADCLGEFRNTWEALDKTAKSDHWKRLSLWLLQHSPQKALEFFLVTSQSTDKPVFIMVSDCLIFLDTFYSQELRGKTVGSLTYESVIETCLDPHTWPVLFLPQRGVRLYLKKAKRAQVYDAYKLTYQRRTHLKAETYLCFMLRFIEFGDINGAIKVLERLQRLHQHGFSLNSAGVMRHCCKLLLLDSVVDGPDGRNFRILPRLLELGVRPDRDMMNVVLSNAFKTGDPQLGLDMLNFMTSQGLEPDSYTYLTLLSDAVSRGDRERVQSLIQEIKSRGELQKNPWIASKMFHAHFVFTAKHADSDADLNAIFYSMLDMYNQLHDITPLKELSIIPPEYTPPPGGDNLPPSPVALYLMIATYLRCQKRIFHAQRIYYKFRTLVASGHESIAQLGTTDHTYNEFLVAFRNDPRGLRPSVRLVEDMLQSATDAQADPAGPVPARPSVRTWTLLLSAFTFNRQPLAAEKVREMMAKHGVEYNMVTWNTIINGYANAQNIPQVANTIKAMEEQGFSIDAYTMKCLRYLRDPERLWVAVEELDKASESGLQRTGAADASHADESQVVGNEDLLDQGLQRLRERMEPKL
ncbi:hypothetical protein BDV59DRAFT_188598 [Aspergillus ambiguus]|uniref:pentatricopeptide repeat protein n=1 Tax=Aspergillus ambiguus TaxID=176160 RepID=UPI003CCDCDBF